MEKRQTIKKWLLCTGLILMSMLAGTSCVMDNDDLPDCPPEPVPSKDAPAVTAYIYCNNKRIDWEEGNKIGVYMIDNEREVLLQDSLGAPYVLNDNPTGLFIPQWGVGDQVLTRPELGVTWDATGIYPYGTSLKNTNTFNLSILDQKAQDKLDVFTAKRVTNVTAYTDTLHLDLYRRMSRILFNMTLTEVKADKSEAEANDKLAGATIQVSGLPVNGTFTFSDNTLKTSDVQPFQAYVTENGKQGQAIVFPAESTKDVRFQVSLPQYPDTVYSFVLSEDMMLEECNSYEFEMNMKYVYKPEVKKYNVKYRYEGAANKDNVIVTRGDGTTLPWGEGDVIVVEENSDFTFRYTSSLQVSVRTEDGETLPMTSGKPYTFEQIQKDITVIIYVEEAKPDPDPEPEKTYKVTYRYEGEANANNVNVFKNGMSTAWAQTETITVKENEDFTFGFRSDMVVTVKTKDGKNLSMGSGNPYTFTKINKDIEIIIYAETPEYAVKYVFVGEYTEENVNVQKGVGQNTFQNWIKAQTVWVREGDNFTFKADQTTNSGFPITITVKAKDKVVEPENGSYTLKNIYEDITIVISTDLHKVFYEYTGEATKDNVSVYKSSDFTDANKWTDKTEIIYVDHDKNFTFGTYSRHELVVTENSKSISPESVSTDKTKNTFELKKIQEDKKVIIGAKTEEDLLEHKVIYLLYGAAEGATTVTTTDDQAWAENNAGVKTVKDGEGFSFNASCQWNLTVTAFETNNPGNSVAVNNSGNSYSLSNIKKNVTVHIEATTHTVSFTYEGVNVNEQSTPLTTGGASWKPGTDGTVTVDHNDSFTFTNKSPFTITVTQKEGETTKQWEVAPGKSHNFDNVTSNINLVVTQKTALLKVTYVFDETPAEWVSVADNRHTTWAIAEARYVESGKDFTIDCSSAKDGVSVTYVKTSDDAVLLGPTSGKTYTLADVTKDEVLHIKAKKQHKMTYEIKTAEGTIQPSGFKVYKDGSSTVWTTGTTETVSAGTDFTLAYSNDEDYTITVQRKANNATADIKMVVGENQSTYKDTDVQTDIHYIITLAKKPTLTITITGQSNIVDSDITGGTVEYNSTTGEFKPTISNPKWGLTVSIKKNGATTAEPLSPDADEKYKVDGITKDTEIIITPYRKPANMPIDAKIHIWEDLPEVNGGVIYPKSK